MHRTELVILTNGWENKGFFWDQTCNTHIWMGKYALVFVVIWISNGIFNMQVLHFGIGFSTTLTLSVNYQNMQYLHTCLKICYGFLDWICNTDMLGGKIGVGFFLSNLK